MPLDLTQFTGHTPGPWVVGQDPLDTNDGARRIYAGSVGFQLATVYAGPEVEANAALCASAPDLLRDLTSARERIGRLEEAITAAKPVLDYIQKCIETQKPMEAKGEACRLWWLLDSALEPR